MKGLGTDFDNQVVLSLHTFEYIPTSRGPRYSFINSRFKLFRNLAVVQLIDLIMYFRLNIRNVNPYSVYLKPMICPEKPLQIKTSQYWGSFFNSISPFRLHPPHRPGGSGRE